MARAAGSYDVAIIGGGASGLAAAIIAARDGAAVAVIERDVACGLPILATGNGRCNISNEHLDPRRYLHVQAARTVLGGGEGRLDAFFASVGIMTSSIEGRMYPVTRRADSVRDALLAACGREGVDLLTCSEAVSARAVAGRWKLVVREPVRDIRSASAEKSDLRRARKALGAVERRDRAIAASSAIIAVGGASDAVCGLFGLEHLEETPLLTPIACSPEPRLGGLAGLDGMRAEGMISLHRKGAAIAYESGEVLFRDYGVSGIAAFNLSRRCERGDVIELDLFPDVNQAALEETLRDREAALGRFAGDPSWFDGMLARPLANLACKAAEGTGDPISALAAFLHHISLTVEGPCEARQAQVRRGGIPLSSVDFPSCRVHRDGPALFACGEALDMDADCGGYNLAWAWTTGMNAGASAARAARHRVVPAPDTPC